jgi:DNA-binding transcriptional regulator YiaG
MNGDILYRLRDALDLSEETFGTMLGLSGENVKDTIHAMEKNRKPISGPLKELIPRIASENGYHLSSGQWVRIGEK